MDIVSSLLQATILKSNLHGIYLFKTCISKLIMSIDDFDLP